MLMETERLFLRPLSMEDLYPLHSFMGRKEVMYAWEHGFTENEVREWIERQVLRYDSDGIGYWGVVLKESSLLIGQAGLLKSIIDGKEAVELGYIFDSLHWHNGYAAEAARSCIRYAFIQLGLDEMYCTIRPENVASVRLAERLGMTPYGSYTKIYKNKPMPHTIYRLENSQTVSTPSLSRPD